MEKLGTPAQEKEWPNKMHRWHHNALCGSVKMMEAQLYAVLRSTATEQEAKSWAAKMLKDMPHFQSAMTIRVELDGSQTVLETDSAKRIRAKSRKLIPDVIMLNDVDKFADYLVEHGYIRHTISDKSVYEVLRVEKYDPAGSNPHDVVYRKMGAVSCVIPEELADELFKFRVWQANNKG